MEKKKKLENGKATEGLCQYIPEDKLLTLINVYHAIHQFQDNSKHIISKNVLYPVDNLNKITKALNQMQRNGWLSQKGVERIKNAIDSEIMTSKRQIAAIKHEYFRKRKVYYSPDSGNVTERGLQGRITNDAFNILIYAIYLMMPKGKPRHELLAGFILEQKIIEKDIKLYKFQMKETIKQQLLNIKKNPDLLKERYKYYRNYHSVDIKPNFKGKELILYHNLPTWKELISKK